MDVNTTLSLDKENMTGSHMDTRLIETIVIHRVQNYFYLQNERKAWMSLSDLLVK